MVMLPRCGTRSSRTSMAQEFVTAPSAPSICAPLNMHQPIGGAPQVQRLGAAGHGSRQQVFGNRDEVSLRAGLHLKIAFDLAG